MKKIIIFTLCAFVVLSSIALSSCDLVGTLEGMLTTNSASVTTGEISSDATEETSTDGVSESDTSDVPSDGTTQTPDETTQTPAETTPSPDESTQAPDVTRPSDTEESTSSSDTSSPDVSDTEPPHVHAYGEWETESAPTCTSEGKETRKCACGDSEIHTTEKLPHIEVTDAGYSASCTVDGLTDGKHCTKCGEVTVKQQTITAPGHTEGEWIIDKKPTVLECGSKHQVCAVCGATLKTESIPTLVHTPSDWIVAKEASCSAEGLRIKVCLVCEETIESETISKLPHVEITDAGYSASCTVDGLTDGKHCSKCGEVTVKQEAITATGHVEVTDAGYSASCTVDGLTDGKHCTECGEITVKQQTITAPGHTEGEWIIDKKPTVLECGSKHQVCDVCGETIKTESIPTLVHIPSEWILTKSPSCSEEGLRVKFCLVCGEIVESETLKKLDHTEVTDKGYAPSCLTDGLTDGKHCIECGEITLKQQTIASSGHTEVTDKGYAASCLVDGLTDGKHCIECGEITLKQQTIAAEGHKIQSFDGIAASCSSRGYSNGTMCAVCLEVFSASESYLLAHEYKDGYCVSCNEREGSAGIKYMWLEKGRYVEVTGYYAVGIDSSYKHDALYFPSSVSTKEHGVSELIGIHDEAFYGYSYATRVYFSKNIKVVGHSAFANGNYNGRRFYLNEGIEIIEPYSLGYVVGSIEIPESVRAVGARFAENLEVSFKDSKSTFLYFKGDFPEYLGTGYSNYNVDEMFFGAIVIYDPNKSGWPGGNCVIMHQGVLYRNDYDPDALYDDDIYAQLAIATELCYQTALNAYPQWATMDWSLVRVTNTPEKYEFFLSLAKEITKDCTTNAEKIDAIYKWVRKNIKYDLNSAMLDMYDAVIAKKGVCAHYANIMVQMLRCLNIPSMVVTGYLWDGIDLPFPEGIKWADDNYWDVEGNHAWVIAYDGESFKTYDPTNNYIFKDYDPSHRFVLFPTSVEGLQISGEGFYTRAFYDAIPLYFKDGRWYRKTELGYDVTVNGFWYGQYLGASYYNQASDIFIYYRLIYSEDGTLETGLVSDYPFMSGGVQYTTYYYVLDNGRVLCNVTLTINGVEYYFNSHGECTLAS